MNENLPINTNYFNALIAIDFINILFIGKDPYPSNPNGIPFCKDNIKDLIKPNCSGKHLLFSLGINVETETKEPNDIFFNLLEKQKIGFVNASYYPIKKGLSNLKEIESSELLNANFFYKSKKIVAVNSSMAILKKYKKYEAIKDKIIRVYHPDYRNRISQHKTVRDAWNSVYSRQNGLQIMLENEK